MINPMLVALRKARRPIQDLYRWHSRDECCEKIRTDQNCCPSPCPPSSSSSLPPKPVPDCSPGDDGSATEKMLRHVCLYGLLPLITVLGGYVFLKIKEDEAKPRPEFIPYSYMGIHTKRFPWGDGKHSFFHNPRKNPIYPHGYETEDPNSEARVSRPEN